MVTIHDALDIIYNTVTPKSTHIVPIEASLGSIVAKSYKASFDSAVKRAEALPVKQETPDVPGTPSDNTPVNPDNYTDATAVPTETPVPAAP